MFIKIHGSAKNNLREVDKVFLHLLCDVNILYLRILIVNNIIVSHSVKVEYRNSFPKWRKTGGETLTRWLS